MTLRDLPRQIDGIDEIKVLVINDDSTDSTVEIAEKEGVSHILDLPVRSGLAEVFRNGMVSYLFIMIQTGSAGKIIKCIS